MAENSGKSRGGWIDKIKSKNDIEVPSFQALVPVNDGWVGVGVVVVSHHCHASKLNAARVWGKVSLKLVGASFPSIITFIHYLIESIDISNKAEIQVINITCSFDFLNLLFVCLKFSDLGILLSLDALLALCV